MKGQRNMITFGAGTVPNMFGKHHGASTEQTYKVTLTIYICTVIVIQHALNSLTQRQLR